MCGVAPGVAPPEASRYAVGRANSRKNARSAFVMWSDTTSRARKSISWRGDRVGPDQCGRIEAVRTSRSAASHSSSSTRLSVVPALVSASRR